MINRDYLPPLEYETYEWEPAARKEKAVQLRPQQASQIVRPEESEAPAVVLALVAIVVVVGFLGWVLIF